MKSNFGRVSGVLVAASMGFYLSAMADTQFASFSVSSSVPGSQSPVLPVNWEPFQQDRGMLYEVVVCGTVTVTLNGTAVAYPPGSVQGTLYANAVLSGQSDGSYPIAAFGGQQTVSASGTDVSPGLPQTLTGSATLCNPATNSVIASSAVTKYVQVSAFGSFPYDRVANRILVFTSTSLSYTVSAIIKYNYIPDAPFPPSLDDPEPDWDDASPEPDLKWKPTPHAADGYGAAVRPVFRPAALLEAPAYSNNSIPPDQHTLHVSSETNETTGDGAMSPSGLEPCQWYSWQITAKNGSLSTPSAVQYFRVGIGGDLNHDRMTDDADFVIFLGAYNMLDCADPAMPAGCPADFNRDGVVDDGDFIRFVHGYDMLICP